MMELMEYQAHAQASDLAKKDREIRKGATPKGITLWNKLGVPERATSDDIFILVDCMMYRSVVELYNLIKEKHWK